MLNDPLVFSIAAVVVILIGVSKAGFAGGTGVIATPLLCLVLADPKDAIALLLPILCACDWFSLYCYRKRFAVRPLALILPGALVGITGGAFLLGRADKRYLTMAVGGIAIFFVVYRVIRHLRKGTPAAWKPGPIYGSLFGAAAGLFSTLAHAAGPVAAAYLLPQNLGRKRYVGTTVVFFTVVNHVKLIPYALLGMLEVSNLKQSLLLAPFVPAGVLLGVWLNRRLNERVFLVIIYILLFSTGIKLIWNS